MIRLLVSMRRHASSIKCSISSKVLLVMITLPAWPSRPLVDLRLRQWAGAAKESFYCIANSTLVRYSLIVRALRFLLLRRTRPKSRLKACSGSARTKVDGIRPQAARRVRSANPMTLSSARPTRPKPRKSGRRKCRRPLTASSNNSRAVRPPRIKSAL